MTMSAWVPAANPFVVSEAVPAASGRLASSVAPSKNCTKPPGAAPPPITDTVAVSVTGWLKPDGLGDATSDVAVAARTTVSVRDERDRVFCDHRLRCHWIGPDALPPWPASQSSTCRQRRQRIEVHRPAALAEKGAAARHGLGHRVRGDGQRRLVDIRDLVADALRNWRHQPE